jgi:FlaA1/EpsC-like NDP-sugar epimerase
MYKRLIAFSRPLVLFADISAFLVSYALAFLLRFDFQVPGHELSICASTIGIVVLLRTGAFAYFGAYAGVWRYASMSDLNALFKAVSSSQIFIIASLMLIQHPRFPRSVLFIDPLLTLILVGSIRFAIRLTREWRYQQDTSSLPRVLIFGAGDLGESIVRDMQRRDYKTHRVIGFIDDDPAKLHRSIHGIAILGCRQDLPRIIAQKQIDEIVVAVNHSRGPLIKSLMEICPHSDGFKVQFKTVPTLEETLRKDNSQPRGMRKIELADLLPRKSVKTDLASVRGILQGKTVLVTGAGGTIGSELARQIMRFGPSKLLLLEKHNTDLFYIDRELSAMNSVVTRLAIAGDVGDADLLENLFVTHRPQLVFHAAAHKHVPLMESNPQEAVKNNTLCTHLLAEKCARHGVERFLFISTDKAVRPTSVMGVSKRMAEMIIRAFSGTSSTKFISVRFGNVLGSSGSAINIFKEQIAQGGPVTVTHPDVTRYFMTTEEAVQLILHAAFLGRGGEIFVLNMGEPVKVLDVARNLILLSGFEPDRDIKIVFTGMRPGEKMYEELFRPHDVRMDTGHPDIFAAVPEEADLSILRDQISELKRLCSLADSAPIRNMMKDLVPAYQPAAPTRSP